ncbi:MAG: hypothetical protein IJE78_04910 [Bacteroidaceae bacterium]|nr:hypothetical protein [Bacteroidaceae bacterium]
MKRYIKSADYASSKRPELYRDISTIHDDVGICWHPDWEPAFLEYINTKRFQTVVVPRAVEILNDTTDLWGQDFRDALVEKTC